MFGGRVERGLQARCVEPFEAAIRRPFAAVSFGPAGDAVVFAQAPFVACAVFAPAAVACGCVASGKDHHDNEDDYDDEWQDHGANQRPGAWPGLVVRQC